MSDTPHLRSKHPGHLSSASHIGIATDLVSYIGIIRGTRNGQMLLESELPSFEIRKRTPISGVIDFVWNF